MPGIHIFIDDKHGNERFFYGKSTSGETFDSSIIKREVSGRSELIDYALETAPLDSYILCAYGPLLSSLTTEAIYNTIENVIDNKSKKIDFDAFYLTLYADECKFTTDEYSYDFMKIRKTVSPHGTECILFSPNGVKKLKDDYKEIDGRSYDHYLNNNGENMSLYTTFPPLISVDISKRNSDTQLIKSTICRENINSEKPIENKQRYNGNMNIFWFFLIIVFIVFIATMLISFGGVNEYYVNNKNDKVLPAYATSVITHEDPVGDLAQSQD